MTDIDATMLRLRDVLTERHSRGEPALVLEVAPVEAARIAALLKYLSVPEAAYVIHEAETRVVYSHRQLPPLLFQTPCVPIVRERAPNEDRVDALLNRYRHNDPEKAAQVRAENAERRRKRDEVKP